MLDLKTLETIMENYLAKLIPAMWYWEYHLILAKGGRDYPHLPEQSMFTHVINGAFGLVNLLRFCLEKNILIARLDEATLRKALALYTIHDVHKLPGFQKIGASEFAIPLERLQDEYQRLGLEAFANVDEYLMRAANVSKRSQYQGDLLLSEEQGSMLWLLVRIADSIASMVSLQEADSLAGYLKQLSPELGMNYRLYYHEIQDVRGVLTNLLHKIVSQKLKTFGFYPCLFFTTGVLYLGPRQLGELDRAKLFEEVASDVLTSLAQYGRDRSDAAVGALRRNKFDFESYVYSFADVETLLNIVLDETLRSQPDANVPREDFEKTSRKKQAGEGWFDNIESRFGVSMEESKEFNEHWSRTRRYLLYVDSLLRDLSPQQDRVEWFIETFEIPEKVALALREDSSLFSLGGIGKYVTVIAYHFLRGRWFPFVVEALPPQEVLERLHHHVLQAFAEMNTLAGRKAKISELGFQPELIRYLREILSFSFARETELEIDIFDEYSNRKKGRGHLGHICSICNRRSEYTDELRAGILEDFGRVFSNRVLPNVEAPGGNRIWCPICHLEFIMRKLVGLSLPGGADYGQAYRIYLYVLPTFSFTLDHIRLFKSFLGILQHVSSFPIRDYGQEIPSVPRLWIKKRTFDSEWMERVQAIFERQAQWIEEHGGRSYRGERLLASRVEPEPNYYLIVWDGSGAELTRIEAWAKATLAAIVITTLTGTRVFVSEHPFLSSASLLELKSTVTLDAAPPIIRSLLGDQHAHSGWISLYGREKGKASDLERAIDLLSALWIITTKVRSPTRDSKDKQIAERLALAITRPLAGAYFYKEYGRLNDGQSPDAILTRACEILLEHLGGEMMDLIERLAEKSLEIRLPFRVPGRGKAHNYELVLREAFSALNQAFKLSPKFRKASLKGDKPDEDSVKEVKKLAAGTLLKAMERRQIAQRGDGFINPFRKDLGQSVSEFIDLLVDEVLLSKRTDGNITAFLRLENTLADGIYFYTDRVLNQKWSDYQQGKAETSTENSNNSI